MGRAHIASRIACGRRFRRPHPFEARRGFEASSSPASPRWRTLVHVALLAVPQPYDFDVSLDRFKFWGVDRANVWHDGGLHRVVDGREVRITPAEGGGRVEPFDDKGEPVVRKLLGLELELPRFHAFAQGDPV